MHSSSYYDAMSRRNWLYLVSAILLFISIAVWAILLTQDRKLAVSFLDVGQGDSILIETPSGADVLIDAGRDRSALRRIGQELGPLDRTIDMVIATHPDADHIGGMPAVFEQYGVRSYVSSGVRSDSNPSLALQGSVLEEAGVKTILAKRGSRIHLGDGVYADVLFPDRMVPAMETNTGSVIVRLVYGSTAFMLTGDAPDEIEDWLVALDSDSLKSTVLKAGHHGSRTSSSEAFIAATDPEIVIVSAGKDNSYGHPHAEVVERIQNSGATLYSTAEQGTIRLESDGASVRVR